MARHRNSRDDNLSFEEAYTQLEQTVHTLESGGLPLAEATRLFEEGLRLARICHQHLNATELKITHLQRSSGEQMEFVPETEPEPVEDGTDSTEEGQNN